MCSWPGLDTALSGAASLLDRRYVGGADYEFPADVAIDPLGAVHVVGETPSTNFPAVNPIRTNFFQLQPFVFKMNAGGDGARLLDALRHRVQLQGGRSLRCR